VAALPITHQSECIRCLTSSSFQPDIKSLQIQLTGFLEKDTAPFCRELWSMCLSAQTSPQGVPKELLEAKKKELLEKVRFPLLLYCFPAFLLSCQSGREG
jgi:hypothetical protein